MSDRRFLPPVEEQEACFVVRDHDGQQLAYVYYENESGRRFALVADFIRGLMPVTGRLCVSSCVRAGPPS